MDAKPQRPLRSFASHLPSNENHVPVVGKPGIHQRHRSVGNLKSMASTGGLRVVAKRTAFGEVSNIVNNVRPAQENKWKAPAVKTQPGVVRRDKENVGRYHHEGSFNQPAQRPSKQASLASAGINLPTARPATSHHEGSSRTGDFVLPESRAPAAKPTIGKKAAFIYQDNHDAEMARQSSTYNTSEAGDGLIVDEQSKNPRRYKSHPHLTFEQPSHPPMDREELKNMEELVHFDDDITEAPYEDAVEDFVNPYELLKTAQQFPDPSLRRTAPEAAPGLTHDEPQAVVIVPKPMPDEAPLPSATSEPEEYWDEYEEEDLYDDQGYTTAHSYRSHGGDTTTGGATTLIIIPKMTARVQMELDAAKAHVEATRPPEDVEEESWDISMVAEYGDEIFEYMTELEGKMLPNPHYMDIQTEIQWSMRSVLMDWLIQVHNRFSLLPETLFLTVNYIDRFLSTKIVSLGKLQLVGATAIFIAAKYEEINCPSIQEIIFMVDSGYSVDEILKAERFMLSMLGFELGWPGPMSFLRRISKADDYDLETRTLAKYFLEVTIMDERFVGSPPSFLAAGAHCLARLMLKKGDWSPAHVHYSGYTWTQLKSLVGLIFECCRSPLKHHAAVHEKYSDRKYKRASIYVENEIEKGFSLPFQQHLSRLSGAGTGPAENDDAAAAIVDCIGREMGQLIPIQG